MNEQKNDTELVDSHNPHLVAHLPLNFSMENGTMFFSNFLINDQHSRQDTPISTTNPRHSTAFRRCAWLCFPLKPLKVDINPPKVSGGVNQVGSLPWALWGDTLPILGIKNLGKKRWDPSPNLGFPNILVDFFYLMVNEYHNMAIIHNRINVKQIHHPSSRSELRKVRVPRNLRPGDAMWNIFICWNLLEFVETNIWECFCFQWFPCGELVERKYLSMPFGQVGFACLPENPRS